MRRKRWIFALGMLLVFLIGGYMLYHYIEGRNIMDRMYQATKDGLRQFNHVPELEEKEYEDLEEYENFGAFSIAYLNEYLEDSYSVALKFPAVRQNYIEIRVNKVIGENALLNFTMSYDYDHKTMIYQPIEICVRDGEHSYHYYDKENVTKYFEIFHITKEDVKEYRRYALYDVVLRTWVNANGGNYEHEVKRMQDTKFIDCSFDYTEEKTYLD